jgi:hypothetical protein
MRYVVFAALGLLACGSSSTEGADASVDSSLTDSPAPKDQSAADSPADSAQDAGVDAPADTGADAIVDSGSTSDAGCSGAGDCRLFSSYCSTASCQCIPLGKNDPDPACGGGTVTCLKDPCLAKTAVCNGSGKCAVGP